MSLISPLKFTETDILELQGQLEELKGLLRANNLLLKDQEIKHAKVVENYESQISRLNEDGKQLKEKYDKVFEAQRKLEKLNSNLEDKLLNIVEKYENEQKNLLEELKLAHSKLVETKLLVEETEHEKEAYKEDCNLAVNLLQCRPSEFVSHSFNSLPLNLKQRLRQCLTDEELMRLEGAEAAAENEKKQASSFKIPVIQPTAAAAMMYGYTSIQREKSKIQQQQQQQQQKQIDQRITDDGRVSSWLLAELLKKDTITTDGKTKSKRPHKPLPYVCLKCKSEVVICDSQCQTGLDDPSGGGSMRIIDTRPRSILTEPSPKTSLSSAMLVKSRTIGTKLSDANETNKSNKDDDRALSTGRLQII